VDLTTSAVSELKIRTDVGDLDLNDRALVAFNLEGALDEFAGGSNPSHHEFSVKNSHALLEGVAQVLGGRTS
jgi:hypothetical protein